jgi:hypothetical protein
MPSAIVKTIFFDLDKLAWTITAGGNALLQPLTIGQNDTIDFNVQFIKSGAAQTLTSPTFSAGIKVLNGFSNAFVVQFGAPTGTPPTYTFTATISSTELSAALLTGVQFAIEFRDSTNGIVTLPALTLNIVASYTISGTTPTSANGTLNVTAGKTVTFPQSLTFPSDTGTDNYQLTTNGDGVLTWEAGGALTDGDKGEITVSASGATWTIDNDVITLAKLAHMPTARVVGRTTGGTGTPELLTISGTGSVAMTNTPTLVAPVLGAATATSINGIPIYGDATALGIDMTASGGALDTSAGGGNISTSTNGGNINTSGGGGTIDTTGTGSIGLGNAGANTMTTFTGAASGSNKSIALPNLSGTVVVTASTSATVTQALFATATAGAPAYRAIASADIATALLTPGPIGTTPNTGAFTTLSGTSTLTLGVAGPTGTAGTVVLKNATNAFTTTIVPSVVTASRQLNLPLITGTDTVAVLGLAQTFSGNKTFSGTVSCTSTLGVSGATTCSTTLAVTQETTLTGLLTANGGITVVGGTNLLTTNTALTDHSSSTSLTLGSAGPNIYTGTTTAPSKWIAINDNGTIRYIPTWHDEPPPP